jgi:hypothetical protein
MYFCTNFRIEHMNENIIKSSVSNRIADENGTEYKSIRSLAVSIGVNKGTIIRSLKKGEPFVYKGHTYRLADVKYVGEQGTEPQATPCEEVLSPEYQEFLESKNIKELPFESYGIQVKTRESGSKYAIALFSDAHIEETVEPATVDFLNEYNIDIARQRIKAYFTNLVTILKKDKPQTLIFASLGDTISGYIHDELSQKNGLTPLEAIYEAQNLLFNGLKYICDNTDLKKIEFIGIVGNHSRTTKKIQHANGYAMSYEWLMYKNVQDKCEEKGLPINFNIPSSEIATIKLDDGKRYMFAHGFQIKSSGNGTVCGIYPALNRLTMKWERTFKQDKIFIGHFHTCVSIPNAVVNGSIIGFNTFSLTNGFTYEEPAQMYELYDTNIGLILTRKIYCK